MKQLIKSILVNGRDIIFSAILILCVLIVAEIIAFFGGIVGINLDDFKDFVFASAKFAMVMLCGVGYVCHVTFRHSLGDHDLNEYLKVWKELEPKERLGWFLKFCMAGMIAAALVFSIGV